MIVIGRDGNYLYFQPVHGLTYSELNDEFQTSSDKLKHIIEHSVLPKYINQILPFSNGNCQNKYFTEDEFNHLTNKIHLKFSAFHLNIRSLSCNHGELIAYLHLLNNKCDCICLSEIWNYNLEFYNNILPGYTAYFDKVQGSNIGGVAIFANSSLMVIEREDYKFLSMKKSKQKIYG